MDDKPITRAEMVELLAPLATDVTTLKADLVAMKREIIEEVQERVRDAQTKILKTFSSFQENANVRIRIMESTEASVSERMNVIERRLWEIEKRLLLNPPAA